MSMFYTLTVCPSCQEVDVIPDDDCELSENVHVVSECWQCAFENSDAAMYMDIDMIDDHADHVLAYHFQERAYGIEF